MFETSWSFTDIGYETPRRDTCSELENRKWTEAGAMRGGIWLVMLDDNKHGGAY
jgi:hypothetical protein